MDYNRLSEVPILCISFYFVAMTSPCKMIIEIQNKIRHITCIHILQDIDIVYKCSCMF